MKVTSEWLKENNESVDFLSIMKGWWSEGQLREKPSPVEWKAYKFRKKCPDHIHSTGKSFCKEICFNFSRKMDSHYSTSHHTWMNIELG